MLFLFWPGNRKATTADEIVGSLPDLAVFLFWPPEALEGAGLFLSDPEADPAMTVT